MAHHTSLPIAALDTITIMISDETINQIREFIADHDWRQFYTPDNMAKSISIEAGELLECFQWSDEPRDGDWEHAHEELADVRSTVSRWPT